MTFALHPLLRTLPPLEMLERAVARDASELTIARERSRLPIAVQSEALVSAPTARLELAALLTRGVALVRESIVALASGGSDARTREDLEALEALRLVYGRPAIPVRDDQLPSSTVAGWEVLGIWRDTIELALRSVGRIEVGAGDARRQIGTGFLIGPGLVATARHVASKLAGFAARKGHGLEGDTRIDWRVEADRPDAFARFPVTEIAWVHPSLDVAVLRVTAKGAEPERAALPTPLVQCAHMPTDLDDALVYTVGYPASGGEGGLATEWIERIFPGLLGTKRVQPGRLLSPAMEAGDVRHDCSTLGGSSGSPLFLLERGDPVVIGVHVSGSVHVANYAVPTWAFRNALPTSL